MLKPESAPCSMVVTSAAPKSFAADIGNENRGAIFADWNDVKVVAAHFVAGMVHAGDGEVGKVVQSLRNERLLDGARNGKLLLETLALLVRAQPAAHCR